MTDGIEAMIQLGMLGIIVPRISNEIQRSRVFLAIDQLRDLEQDRHRRVSIALIRRIMSYFQSFFLLHSPQI
jgi:hypothetical protein